MDEVKITAERIKRLEIQGATSIALASIKALAGYVKQIKVTDRNEVLDKVQKAARELAYARLTEPATRNSLRYICGVLTESDWCDGKSLIEETTKAEAHLLELFRSSREKVVDYGSRRIRDGYVVFTHCHSSAVTEVLRKARDKGISFEVIVTETRPVYQGRITARELIEMGLKCTMITDSAARSFINGADIVMVGADAVTSEGSFINKIGTSFVALLANESRVPFYEVTELIKFDHSTILGEYEKIEERSPDEVWPDAPRGLIIRNPAFDVTRRDRVHGLVCEAGVIPPGSAMQEVRRLHPWILDLPELAPPGL